MQPGGKPSLVGSEAAKQDAAEYKEKKIIKNIYVYTYKEQNISEFKFFKFPIENWTSLFQCGWCGRELCHADLPATRQGGASYGQVKKSD